MRRTTLVGVLIAGLTAGIAPVAMADSGLERSWSPRIVQPDINSTSDDNSLTPTRNWANSPVDTPQQTEVTEPQAEQAVAEPPRKKTRRKNTASRKSKKKYSEAAWWEKVGNPPVDDLRECIAAFAVDQTSKGSADASADDIMRKAIEGQCEAQHADMEKILKRGLSRSRYRKAMAELVRTTFRPAAAEVLVAAAKQAPAAPRPAVGEPAVVEDAKQAMFDCFNREADSLALQDGSAPPLLAREVVARCDEATRTFFAGLFTAYPVDPKAHEASIRIAVEQNYMPAIASRIGIVRQGSRLLPVEDATGEAPRPASNTTVVTKQ